MTSIFSFWATLFYKKTVLREIQSLNEFPYDNSYLSYSKLGKGFPNFSIKVNQNSKNISGGELIKIKESKNYSITPFNSFNPIGKWNINDTTFVKNDFISEIKGLGNEESSFINNRDVYYLISGRRNGFQKICLVHGSFFETMPTKDLVNEAFFQILDERLSQTDIETEAQNKIKEAFSKIEVFNRRINLDNASLKVKIRTFTKVKPEGNILNSTQYPEILDNSLNLLCPFYSEEEKQNLISNMELTFGEQLKEIKIFSIKHPLNGWFLVFQTNL